MTGIDLTAVMDGLAAAVDAALASDKTCYAYPVEDLTIGDAVVGYPETIEVTQTFRRGMDRATVPVYLIAGLSQDKSTRDTIADFITGSGSLITAIESYSTGSPWSSAAVQPLRIEAWQPAGRPQQLAVVFPVDIIS